jgi:lipid-A-disaccharide synthase
MAEVLDGLGAIFPFEVECYRDTDLPVHFTGHPFVRESYQNPLRFDPEGPILLLPGSRRQAVGRIFPILLETLRLYHAEGGTRRCVCLYPEDRIRRILEEAIGRGHPDSTQVALRPVEQGTTAAAVLTSSGTMSLNCALAGIPGAIVYRAHPLTAWMGRRLIRIPWLGIANLVLGRDLYPEYLQGRARPPLLAGLLQDLLSDAESSREYARAAEELRERLRPGTHSTVTERIGELI